MKSHHATGRPGFVTLALLAAVPLATLSAAPAVAAVAAARPAKTVLASVASNGSQANLVSQELSLSGDGRRVAFVSEASNLVPGDTNDTTDVFVHDLKTGVTQRASVTSSGQQSGGIDVGGGAYTPSLSGDGRYVAFASSARNQVPDDTNGTDIFVRDLRKGVTTRVSVQTGGAQADNQYVSSPTISADGRYVAFVSDASNLVPGDTNGTNDVFVRDLRKGVTRLVSVATGGAQQVGGRADESAISANGRFVVFESFAPNLVPGDTNGLSDIFVHDLKTGTTKRASVGPGGVQGVGGQPKFGLGSLLPSISGDGQVVAFESYATNLVADPSVNQLDSYAHNMVTGVTQRIAVGPGGVQGDQGGGFAGQLSWDGRYVVFVDASDNLVAGDINAASDVFVRDLRKQQTSLVSIGAAGQGNQSASEGAISRDARHVAFASYATNLVSHDTNGTGDIFVR
jgi:Tol biopolymer transport system component